MLCREGNTHVDDEVDDGEADEHCDVAYVEAVGVEDGVEGQEEQGHWVKVSLDH